MTDIAVNVDFASGFIVRRYDDGRLCVINNTGALLTVRVDDGRCVYRMKVGPGDERHAVGIVSVDRASLSFGRPNEQVQA